MARNDLQTLARLYGVHTTYADVWGTPHYPSEDTVLRALQLLGAPLARTDQAADALRHRRQQLWHDCIEPVLVAWDGRLTSFDVRLPNTLQEANYHAQLDLEDGNLIEFEGRVSELSIYSRRDLAGERYLRRRMTPRLVLPHGYHRLRLSLGDQQGESLVIAAPTRAFGSDATDRERLWGVFLPLYALHRQSNHGAGDFSDLEALMEWTAARGGNLVATLPLLATLWERTDDPSPYNPASRLFWNEFYLALNRTVGFEDVNGLSELHDACPPLVGTEAPEYVDYPREVAQKRRVIQSLAAEFFARPSAERKDLTQYCRKHPELERFAQFRAVGERLGRPWSQWPEPLRGGVITDGDYDEDVFRYHLFTQWQVEQQLETLADHAQRLNLLWYLDFPLGVSGDGYDVWREPDLFVREASGGAPPDSFFTKGQNWGFPPLNPERLRRQGYRYFILALRNHLRHARVLRLDHVMGLHRLYWIPHGFPATDGTYVRYPMDELCAILTLESHRFRAGIVGENLGTVPAAVDEALMRHGLDDMYVLQYETNPEKGPTLRRPPSTAVASVNTHDMPQFAAYWQGLDLDDRVDLGLLTAEEATLEQSRRSDLRAQLIAFLRAEHLLRSESPEIIDVLEACQAYLAKSSARIVLVNLEDLWGETEPQNVPGTYRERPNWRRKTKYPLEVFTEMPIVHRVLDTVRRMRQL